MSCDADGKLLERGGHRCDGGLDAGGILGGEELRLGALGGHRFTPALRHRSQRFAVHTVSQCSQPTYRLPSTRDLDMACCIGRPHAQRRSVVAVMAHLSAAHALGATPACIDDPVQHLHVDEVAVDAEAAEQ